VHGPPGWPSEVPPPQATGWEHRAVGWLLDQCPADLRGYGVLTRHPRLLAFLAVRHVEAAQAGTRAALASVRADLRDVLAPHVLAEAIDVLELELARLLRVRRSATLVEEALAGRRPRPRL
jgi:hypothetical protein